MENLLEPLTFGEGEIDRFITSHRCACGSHLVKYAALNRMYTARCPACDLPVIASGYAHVKAVELAKENELSGMRLLRDEPRHSPKQILSELGFD
jgi:hypothetical protein